MAYTVTYTFTNGTVADADEVNQNFTDVENELNASTIAGKGLKWVAGGTATKATNGYQEVATYTFTAGDLQIGDMIIIEFTGAVGGAAGPSLYPVVKVTDVGGPTTVTFNPFSARTEAQMCKWTIVDDETNVNANCQYGAFNTYAANNTESAVNQDTLEANWITKAFTVAIGFEQGGTAVAVSGQANIFVVKTS